MSHFSEKTNLPDWSVENCRIILDSESLTFAKYDIEKDIISLSPLALIIKHPERKGIMESNYNKEITSSFLGAILLHQMGHRVLRVMARDSMMSNWVKELFVRYMEDDVAVTKYGETDKKERFAEAFLYYFNNPEILKDRDPVSYSFIKHKILNENISEEKFTSKEGEKPDGSIWTENDIKYSESLEENNLERERQKPKTTLGKKKTGKEIPFIREDVEPGLVQKSQPQEDPLENPEYGFGSATGSMTVEKAKTFKGLADANKGDKPGDS